jgi:hypothetical protein
MKKKFRKIIVDDVPFAWGITNTDDEKLIQIWLDKKPWYRMLLKQDSIITPKIVRGYIQNRLHYLSKVGLKI